ncbi:MAG: hypothetical protein ACRD3G_17040 [Vicinamibacterales bacterium]
MFALAGLAAGCGGITNPTGPSPSAGELSLRADVPLKGTLDGAYALEFAGPTLLVTGAGTGNATQLGRFTFEYDEVVDLSTGTGRGTYEFTAANGDRLTADWTGYGLPTETPTVLLVVENATITGGTGRFANASGSFTIERLFDFITNSGGGSLKGTMRLR